MSSLLQDNKCWPAFLRGCHPHAHPRWEVPAAPPLPSTQKTLCKSVCKERPPGSPAGAKNIQQTHPRLWQPPNPGTLGDPSTGASMPVSGELRGERHHTRMRCLGAEGWGLVTVTLELRTTSPQLQTWPTSHKTTIKGSGCLWLWV